MSVAAPTAAEAALPRGQVQRILVVYDEYSVRQIAREALEVFRYLVEEAADVHEAISILSQAHVGGQAFDLVILDLSMPRMGGRESLASLRARDTQA